MARYSLGHGLPGGFTGRVYFGGGYGRGRGRIRGRGRAARGSTVTHITLTPEVLRELRELDAQRWAQAKVTWRWIAGIVLVLAAIALVIDYWFIFLPIAIAVGIWVYVYKYRRKPPSG